MYAPLTVLDTKEASKHTYRLLTPEVSSKAISDSLTKSTVSQISEDPIDRCETKKWCKKLK